VGKEDICGKSFSLINHYYRCGELWLPLKARRALVNALVVPIADYGSIIHSGLSASNKRNLQRIQNCWMRFICIRVTLKGLNHPVFEQAPGNNGSYSYYILFYKVVVKGTGPGYIIDKFRYQANIHRHHLTRNHSHLFIILFP